MQNRGLHTLSRISLAIFLCALALTTTLSLASRIAHADPPLDSTAAPDAVLTWNTFLGSTAHDFSGGVARDSGGNVYVTGTSSASWGTPIRAFTGFNDDAFVAKLDPNGALLWSTFLGGSAVDHSAGVAVDSNGNVYVSGISGGTWGTPVRAFSGFNDDAFVAKLDTNGALLWNTFLGGDSPDHSRGIAVDASGNAHVAGISGGTWGTPVRAFSGLNDDSFAAKLDTNGALTWNTFLGGDGVDHSTDVGVHGNGTVVVSGISTGSWGTPVRAFSPGGNDDAYAAKLDANGALTWNTFLGGSGVDHSAGIAAGSDGNVYVSGISTGTWGAPIRPFTGFNDDAFAVKLGSDGALAWNTFLGSNSTDHGAGIAVDTGGNVYLSGISGGTWGTPVRPFTGFNDDAFAVKLDSGGTLVGNTFLGGGGIDHAAGIITNSSGDLYLAGQSTMKWGAPLRPHTGGFDAFAARIPDIISCAPKPEAPLPLKPGDGVNVSGPRVKLDWTDAACAETYQLTVREGSRSGLVVLKKGDLKKSKATIKAQLTPGVTYFWRVQAINSFGKRNSPWRSFTFQ